MIQIRLSVSSFDLQKHLAAHSIFCLKGPQVLKPWIAPPANVLLILLDVSIINADA